LEFSAAAQAGDDVGGVVGQDGFEGGGVGGGAGDDGEVGVEGGLGEAVLFGEKLG
jgi:hypothetical protein